MPPDTNSTPDTSSDLIDQQFHRFTTPASAPEPDPEPDHLTNDALSEAMGHASYFDDTHNDNNDATSTSSDSLNHKPCPYDNANFISRLLFVWLEPLMWRGARKPLELNDLPGIRQQEEAKVNCEAFMQNWERSDQRLLLTLHYTWGLNFYLAAILKFLYDSCELVQPILLKYIIQYAQNDQASAVEGWIILLAMVLLQIASFILINQYFFIVVSIGKQVISGLRSVLYRKILRLSNESRGKLKSGAIVNLMASDSGRIGNQSTYLHLIWSALYQMLISMIFLFVLLRWAALIGLVIVGILVPTIALLSKYIQKKRKEMLKFTDKRIGIINEILNSIRVVKFYVWEDNFLHKAADQRNAELSKISQVLLVKLFSNTLTSLSPLTLSLTSFLVYALLGNSLDSAVIFPALSYYYLIRFPISLFPSVLSNLFEAKVSIDRIEDFLKMEEMTPLDGNSAVDEYPVELKNATFVWKMDDYQGDNGVTDEINQADSHNIVGGSDNYAELEEEQREDDEVAESKDVVVDVEHLTKPQRGAENGATDNDATTETSFRLSDITLRIPKGKLTIIVGKVGSGKTSLLESLIGEMSLVSGQVHVSGSIAYCPQKPFIQNATVRENIVFGKEYEEDRFNEVVESCALRPDLQVWPGGEKCELGSRGITTSGGQKSRISLARACYADADIVLLDDIVSAVDSHVQKHIFQHCLTNPSILGNKTRILVTHQLSWAHRGDHIVLMNEGRVSESGSYADLMERKGQFFQLISNHVVVSKAEEQQEEAEQNTTSKSGTGAIEQAQEASASDGKLMEKEERKEGSIKLSVYWKYLNFAGTHFLFSVTFFLIFAQLFQILSSWWLSVWSSNTDPSRLYFYMLMYAGLTVAAALLTVVRDSLYVFMGLSASKSLHSKALARVIRAPLKFFYVNAVGRVLNRFSKDIAQCDDELHQQLRWYFNCLSQIVSTIILMVYMTPLLLILLVPMTVAYFILQRTYRKSSLELQRMLSITRSPVFALFGEVIDGVPTIRAFHQQDTFIDAFDERLNVNMRPLFYQMVSQRWLGVRMEILGRTIIWLSIVFVIVFKGSIDPGLVGLVLTYAIRLTGVLNWWVRSSVDLENSAQSVERLLYYIDEIEQEPPAHTDVTPPQDWPQYGSVKFTNVWFKYRENLPFVVKDFNNVRIFGSEKIGICGKTGSSKSTIVSLLFRAGELSKGKIEIDDVDISEIGTSDLRHSLCILPQDAVLYSGTIRENLDPFNQHSDAEIWRALERAHMKEKIVRLDQEVTEFGGNYSAGEKQLLCLARGFLRQTAKIIVLDEASAMIDQATDKLLQDTIRREFQDRTILIIAHRLRSVIWCDRILVLNDGHLGEFDTPRNLLSNPDSLFSALVRETGKENEKFLREQVFGKGIEDGDFEDRDED